MIEAATDTGERIAAQAKLLFMKYGLRSVSMDDISAALGISKKTVYRYFEDKDALVDRVIGNMISYNQTCCDYDREIADNAIHEIFLAMDFITEIFRSMNPSLLFDMQKYHPRSFSRFSKHKNDYLYTIIKENINRGKAEELYREDVDTEVIARFRVESMMISFNPEFYAKGKQTLAMVQAELTIYFLFGLVSSKGYKLAVKYQNDRIKKLKADEKKK